ncbi:hypothetical protein DRW41_10685 [Neobacillus piezotolerans]|uniref:Uncharacterized protein n=1 Tax=Neobacillus piezotolerans TaxID=2259171 RepID=A0A3D8GRT0_9BACI|nr:hypothetical protein [Neobacillus piezotolerans]RDU37138.1 hypothetical protein DRW41_10685 [Neobacillus piezotolerans]
MEPTMIFSLFAALIRKLNGDRQFELLNSALAANLEKLNELEKGIDALQKGPLYSANIYLSDAVKDHRTEREREENIKSAMRCFIDALGIIEAGTLNGSKRQNEKAIVELFIGYCWLSLKSKEDFHYWIARCISSLNLEVNSLKQSLDNLRNEKENLLRKEKKSLDVANIAILGGGPIGFVLGKASKYTIGKYIASFFEEINDLIEKLEGEIQVIEKSKEICYLIHSNADF